jgi:hypothetical protein
MVQVTINHGSEAVTVTILLEKRKRLSLFEMPLRR